MSASRSYRVAEVAAIAGVTVRTLHHYDAIDLLVPSARSRAGYRLYTERDLLRLQQILIQRELGLPLEQIRRVLDEPAFDLRSALLAQRSALEARAAHTRTMLSAIGAALEALAAQDYHPSERTTTMQDLFNGFNPEQYQDEAQERWGHTDAYRESARRAKQYEPEDWKRFQTEQDQVYRDLARLMQSGTEPTTAEANELVERHRLLIDRWFYPCSQEMQNNLAALYEADARFAANIDKFAAGLTTFLVAAIRARGPHNDA